ncbi:hypothetical protein C8R46DRAFT_1029642 [Mycena filopes]|nr:hypothetical protein C8R46DRAFT_1029642 [Mycena filopes]
MYPPPPSPSLTPGLRVNATAGQFTSTRARTLRRENKENATPAHNPHSPSPSRTRSNSSTSTSNTVKPGPSPRKTTATSLRRALAAGNTAVLGDTLDFPTVSVEGLDGTAMTPATILAALEEQTVLKHGGQRGDNEDVHYHLWVAAHRAIEESSGSSGPTSRDLEALVQTAMELLVVELGMAICERNGHGSGAQAKPHIAFVDPRRNDDAAAMIPATEDGVSAAKALEAEGVHTNLILVATLMHAIICAQAGVAAISIAVGPLLQFHERKRRKTEDSEAHPHPGMEMIQATLEYFKLHQIRTRLVGSDFRQLAEVGALPGFDAVCLSKAQVLEAARYRAAPYNGAGGGSETRSATGLVDLGRPPQHQASMRARQAQHLSRLLEQLEAAAGRSSVQSPGPSGNVNRNPTRQHTPDRFMRVLSGGARRAIASHLYPALGRMELQMAGIERAVREEVAWQLACKTMSLAEVFGADAPPAASPKKRKTKKAKGTGKSEAAAAGTGSLSSQVGAKAGPRPRGKGCLIGGQKQKPLGGEGEATWNLAVMEKEGGDVCGGESRMAAYRGTIRYNAGEDKILVPNLGNGCRH